MIKKCLDLLNKVFVAVTSFFQLNVKNKLKKTHRMTTCKCKCRLDANVGIKINVDMNANNLLTKEYVIKDLFGILAIVNVTNYVMLKNIQIMQIVSVEKG